MTVEWMGKPYQMRHAFEVGSDRSVCNYVTRVGRVRKVWRDVRCSYCKRRLRVMR